MYGVHANTVKKAQYKILCNTHEPRRAPYLAVTDKDDLWYLESWTIVPYIFVSS